MRGGGWGPVSSSLGSADVTGRRVTALDPRPAQGAICDLLAASRASANGAASAHAARWLFASFVAVSAPLPQCLPSRWCFPLLSSR